MEKKYSTVGSSTYDAIKRDIIFGQLDPGSKLKLSILKNNYDASVSTLRETLSRLASEGFVTAEEQRGFFVSPVSRDDLIEISNLRILLEKEALKASIKYGDAEWEGNLVAAYHKLKLMEQRMQESDLSDKEIEYWKQCDREFHQATIQACNSNSLLQIHSIIFEKYLRYQMLVMDYRGKEAVKEHKRLFDATLKRNCELAQKRLEEHINAGLKKSLTVF